MNAAVSTHGMRSCSSAHDKQHFQITITSLGFEPLEITVTPTTSITELKLLIEAEVGISADCQRFSLAEERVLGATVASCGLTHGSLLCLTVGCPRPQVKAEELISIRDSSPCCRNRMLRKTGWSNLRICMLSSAPRSLLGLHGVTVHEGSLVKLDLSDCSLGAAGARSVADALRGRCCKL
jgi:hypothetical protein